MDDQDRLFLMVTQKMGELEETQSNIDTFQKILVDLGDNLLDTVCMLHSTSDNIIFYANMASMTAWHDKRKFLDLVLAHRPSLLWQTCLHGHPIQLLTPLDAALHYRKLDLVSHLLGHPVMLSFKQANHKDYRSMIERSLSLTKGWFKPTVIEAELLDLLNSL